jgi:hypothetical protein
VRKKASAQPSLLSFPTDTKKVSSWSLLERRPNNLLSLFFPSFGMIAHQSQGRIMTKVLFRRIGEAQGQQP